MVIMRLASIGLLGLLSTSLGDSLLSASNLTNQQSMTAPYSSTQPQLRLFSFFLLISCAFCAGCHRNGVTKKPISLNHPQVEAATGKVSINGADSNGPHKPFTWSWGDGQTEDGWFPKTHVYSDTQKEYQVTVTAHYDDGETGEAKTTVSFKPAKAGARKPISLFRPQIEAATGKVTINGVDPNRPGKPFTWNWGDGNTEDGAFPKTHVYSDTLKNYEVTVTAHYGEGETGEAKTTVSFKPAK